MENKQKNKQIAEAFYLTKDIEKYGSGFTRVRREIAAYPTMKFQYRNAGYGFFAEFNYERQKISLEEKSSEKSSEIFSLIAGEPHITIVSIARQLNISTRMVEKYLAKLTSEGKVVRVKGRKTGHWEITDKTGKTD